MREAGEARGEKQREGEENTWRTEHGRLPPPTTHFPPPFSLVFFPRSASPSSFFLYSSPRHAPSLSLSLPLFALYLRRGHLLHVNSPGNDKRLSSDSPVRDCKTTHSSLNHQPLNPQTSDQDLIP